MTEHDPTVAHPAHEKPVVDLPTTTVSEPSQIPFGKLVRNFIRQLRQQGPWITLIEAVDQTYRMITGVPTVRFSQVTPDVFIGGQHIRRGLPRLRARGVTAIVNMRYESDDRERGVALDRYLHLKTIDNTPPTLDHLQEGAAFIAAEIARGGKVYVHCWEGVGRAPTMMAAYLVSAGYPLDEAWARIRQTRPFIRPTPFQMAQVEQFARRCNGDSSGDATSPAPTAS